jgi:hypothetical protein
MAIELGQDLMNRIANVLGLPDRATRLVIDAECDRPASVTVESLLSDAQAKALVAAIDWSCIAAHIEVRPGPLRVLGLIVDLDAQADGCRQSMRFDFARPLSVDELMLDERPAHDIASDPSGTIPAAE